MSRLLNSSQDKNDKKAPMVQGNYLLIDCFLGPPRQARDQKTQSCESFLSFLS